MAEVCKIVTILVKKAGLVGTVGPGDDGKGQTMPTIKLPQAGKTMRSGTVRRWLKPVGAAVAKGDALVEVETEDGLLQVEAPQDGALGAIQAEAGRTVAVHEPLAILSETPAPTPTAPVSATTVDSPDLASSSPTSAAAPAGGQIIPVLMPQAGQSMEEGTILKWHVQPDRKSVV